MLFGKKKQDENEEVKDKKLVGADEETTEKADTHRAEAAGESTEGQETEEGFAMGIRALYTLQDTEDLVVVGRVEGTVRVGDAVYISNPGEDDSYQFVTTVLGIETGPNTRVKEASGCQAALRVERASRYQTKPGSVVFTRTRSKKSVHQAYITALGDAYVTGKKLELTDKDAEFLSLTDCAELWSLFVWFHTKVVKEESEEVVKENKAKLEKLAKIISRKLLETEVIYCVYSKATGEPFLFSKTVARKDGSYMCMPPAIRLITRAYKETLSARFPEDKFEIREISCGADKNGIKNFLGESFYLDGACGVQLINEQVSLAAGMLVNKPDYSHLPEVERPVMNPDLERWLLLIGQMEQTESEDSKTVYKVYYRFLAKEMVKARLLVPTKVDGEIPKPDADGKTVIPKGVTLSFPTVPGKKDRPAVRMYTDWKRLKQGMKDDTDWQGNIQTVRGMIEKFDCAINLTEHVKAGCYVSEELFEHMKNMQ